MFGVLFAPTCDKSCWATGDTNALQQGVIALPHGPQSPCHWGSHASQLHGEPHVACYHVIAGARTPKHTCSQLPICGSARSSSLCWFVDDKPPYSPDQTVPSRTATFQPTTTLLREPSACSEEGGCAQMVVKAIDVPLCYGHGWPRSPSGFSARG